MKVMMDLILKLNQGKKTVFRLSSLIQNKMMKLIIIIIIIITLIIIIITLKIIILILKVISIIIKINKDLVMKLKKLTRVH